MNNAIIKFHRAEQNFFSLISCTQNNFGTVATYATGVHASGLNPAFVTKVDDHVEQNLIACQSFYDQRKLPWSLVVPEYLDNEKLDSSLQKHAYELTGKGVAMMVVLNQVTLPVSTTPLIVTEINDKLNKWSIPLLHGFESTPEITEIYAQRHELASKSNSGMHHFSGLLNNKIVCSLTLSLCDDFVRIDDVATLPDYQKRGYATQLIYEALKFAKHLNINKCFLEASEFGLSIYKKIGFNELFVNRYYEQRVS